VTNTQMKDDTVQHEQETKQMDQLMRQEATLQTVIHDLEDETESLREEMQEWKGISVIKNHTELLVEEHNALLFRMLHDIFSVLDWKTSTWTLRTPGGMPEVAKIQFTRRTR
jgi:hypothetical protein